VSALLHIITHQLFNCTLLPLQVQRYFTGCLKPDTKACLLTSLRHIRQPIVHGTSLLMNAVDAAVNLIQSFDPLINKRINN